MDDDELARRFEEQRPALRALARRMLGSAADADDAVQEAWLRLRRVEPDDVANPTAWLRTTVSRLCLDALRARRTRREDLAGTVGDDLADPARRPEDEALLADAAGRALLAVLDTLAPAERVAFVLHDVFAVPFDEIAAIVGRTPGTAKKLASRARIKVRGRPVLPPGELARNRRVVEAFLAAARAGDLDAVLAVLTPDVVRRADAAALPAGAPRELRGAQAVAEGTLVLGTRGRFAAPALVDGGVGLVVVQDGRLWLALAITVVGDRIAAYDVVADPDRLRRLAVSVLPHDARCGPGPER